jgi:hypothetical protein
MGPGRNKYLYDWGGGFKANRLSDDGGGKHF